MGKFRSIEAGRHGYEGITHNEARITYQNNRKEDMNQQAKQIADLLASIELQDDEDYKQINETGRNYGGSFEDAFNLDTPKTETVITSKPQTPDYSFNASFYERRLNTLLILSKNERTPEMFEKLDNALNQYKEFASKHPEMENLRQNVDRYALDIRVQKIKYERENGPKMTL